ncbi:hypothetical protein WISP_14147 [Willisornis vidua]|uniref:Uncharacterized protein n=1 Tax=Willisornis vidua TaxID=1566151 RepID=A0ABQ9DQE4_9PASS|nr:hypothetical protein WISP_14147 [Willisornis vidua]
MSRLEAALAVVTMRLWSSMLSKEEAGQQASMDFRSSNFSLSKNLLGSIPWEQLLQGSRLLLDIQGLLPPGSKLIYSDEQEFREREVSVDMKKTNVSLVFKNVKKEDLGNSASQPHFSSRKGDRAPYSGGHQ